MHRQSHSTRYLEYVKSIVIIDATANYNYCLQHLRGIDGGGVGVAARHHTVLGPHTAHGVD